MAQGHSIGFEAVRSALLPGDPYQGHLWSILSVLVSAAARDEGEARTQDQLGSCLLQLACDRSPEPTRTQAQSSEGGNLAPTLDQYIKTMRARAGAASRPTHDDFGSTAGSSVLQRRRALRRFEWLVAQGRGAEAVDVAIGASVCQLCCTPLISTLCNGLELRSENPSLCLVPCLSTCRTSLSLSVCPGVCVFFSMSN